MLDENDQMVGAKFDSSRTIIAVHGFCWKDMTVLLKVFWLMEVLGGDTMI